MTDLYAAAARYGVHFTGTLVDGSYHDLVKHDRDYTLSELAAAGGKITRLRMLSDRGCPFYDISYCHATLPNGDIVRVHLDSTQPRKGQIKGDLIAWAKREGVYAKGLGLLDESNWATMNN